ncbi:MAG: type IX secretion system protein PorQ [Bacteroidales bacterium]
MILRKALFAILFCFPVLLQAQKGGDATYSFLGLTNAARVAALGGEIVSLADDDINLVFHNPALLSPAMDRHLTLNYINYFAGVNIGYASYARTLDRWGTFSGGIHYVDYGTFERTDEYGNDQGSFRASEYALNLVHVRPVLDSALILGINFKPVYSSLENYHSLGLAVDVGLLYRIPSSLTSLALVVKNAGFQVFTYAGTREKLPFEIQAGLTQSLAHAPFRFHLTLQHLEKWDLRYETDGTDDALFGEEVSTSRFDVIGDQMMRHVVLGTEFLLGENFHIDLGYNYKRRQEMKVTARPGMVGFSWGVGFRISKFHVAFGRASYHLAGGTSHFSLTTNLSDFYRSR